MRRYAPFRGRHSVSYMPLATFGIYGVPVPETGRTSSSELIKNRAELNESDIRVNNRNKRWAGQILLEKTVADEVRSLMKELPCKLQYDWSRPINAESGRGNRLGRSGNKRPGTRRS
ncbi:hypothetical protein TNCV_332341 [Trichonephila clavipes]|nr:hypothetical protein TNCV_332341 [Trichonephila clavipes]